MGTPPRSLRRRWVYFAARLIEVLWWCPCEYNNIATYRCRYCGRKPPREVRDMLRAVPMPEVESV
ncbi:MAG: hypothetical protein ACRD12_03285 [Acidimicrobiales bacterium]